MIKIIKSALISFFLISLCACGTGWGTCPSFKYELDTFDVENYVGKWYEIARHVQTPFQKGDCGTAEYTLLENGSIKVVNTEYTNGQVNQAFGEANRTDDPFKLKISFGTSIISKLFKGDYRVVDTDYKNYSLVYSCTDIFFGKFYFVWIIAREPVLPEATLERLLNEIQNKFGISKNELRFNNQSPELCGERQ